MNSDDIKALVESQRRAKHKREVERMALAAQQADHVDHILNSIFGPREVQS